MSQFGGKVAAIAVLKQIMKDCSEEIKKYLK